jgi:UDP-4-amino-4-deoxy-L-arabinose formyltransferase/UDP-glucuronic acid dehydrogenase (UDP-4-keto-hexauronic acid decarboxylating)
MRVAIIGRTEILYDTALLLRASGHQIVYILTAKEATEYRRGVEDFRLLAEQWTIPFANSARILEHRDFLAQAQADIAVSINYSGVIPEEVTALFPLGILNAHGGDLPRYRGNACQAWAIINGEEKIGLCIHRMIGGELDSGDIIVRDYLVIDLTTKVTRAFEWIGLRTPQLMLEALQLLGADPEYVLERQSTDPLKTLRCYPRKPEDGRIDWTKPAIYIIRLINACNKPYAGAFCSYEGEKLVIWEAELVEDGEFFCAIPGQVTKISDEMIEVACGTGKVRIYHVEINGQSATPSTWIQSMRKRLE